MKINCKLSAAAASSPNAILQKAHSSRSRTEPRHQNRQSKTQRKKKKNTQTSKLKPNWWRSISSCECWWWWWRWLSWKASFRIVDGITMIPRCSHSTHEKTKHQLYRGADRLRACVRTRKTSKHEKTVVQQRRRRGECWVTAVCASAILRRAAHQKNDS